MDIGFDLAILYRGSLESCNYDCWYCPFAKKQDTTQALQKDEESLAKFINWVEQNRSRSLGILFTPWGEALVREYYQNAIVELSRQAHVKRVVVQTNLSAPLGWLAEADTRSAALWCSFHPSQTSQERFIAQCAKLSMMGIRHSVGVVGLKENFEDIERLRISLPDETCLWVNAYKREPDYYSDSDVALLTKIDPTFPLNNKHHTSLGKPCNAGENAITVNEKGTVHRCHFIEQPLGNLCSDNLESMLKPRTCSNQTCHCYIGYSHLKELDIYQLYGHNLLERVLVN